MKSRIPAVICIGLVICLKAHAFDLFTYLDSAGADDITAVASRKAKSYIRVQLPNGSYVPESYVFGQGGVWRGEKVDDTIDKLTFLQVAHMIAGPLASQNYIPGKDPRTTKLLIMVYWGTSHGQEHANESNGYVRLQEAFTNLNRTYMSTGATQSASNVSSTTRYAKGAAEEVIEQAQDTLMTSIAAVAAENAMRDQADKENVMMLGYDSWWEDTSRYENTPMRYRRQDLLDEIEDDRYFVVLMAYDLEAMRRSHRHRELWETRFSIRERHHAFDEDLPAMAQYASQYFGQDTKGLVHKEVPLGQVKLGTVKSLGEVPTVPDSKAPPTGTRD
jgi:ferredoxin